MYYRACLNPLLLLIFGKVTQFVNLMHLALAVHRTRHLFIKKPIV